MTASATEIAASAHELIEYCYQQGWTDGLPVIPCTEELLAEFLATTPRKPDDVVIHFTSVNRSCTVRYAAINAVMAGCLPSYFPVLLASWDAIDLEGSAGRGRLQSTTGSTPLLVVNGPVRAEIGLNSKGNVFGSGFRANATIGRAIRLTVMNVFGITPHNLDQATQGQPARFSACYAENEEDSPWPGLHEDHGFSALDSTVTAFSLRAISHVEARQTRRPEQFLTDVADTIARTGVLLHATTAACVFVSPEHAQLLADAGWSKADARDFLIGNAVIEPQRLIDAGKSVLTARSGFRAPAGHPDAAVPDVTATRPLKVLASPDAVCIVVAGAANSGVSAVAQLFGIGGEPRPVAVE